MEYLMGPTADPILWVCVVTLFSWVFLKFNRERVTLGHEIGAGAPCIKCGDACTGLDLHYWRKICKVCKCGPEDHKIVGQDREQVRKIGRLFDEAHTVRYNLNRMTVSRTQYLNAPDEKEKKVNKVAPKKVESNVPNGDSQITFEWVPQGATVETATRYMEMLPMESQPIEGTEGADSRKKQIHVQLPAHDQAPELCQNLTDKEAKDMEDFVKEYKENAVGIGMVQPVQAKAAGTSFQLVGAPPVPPRPNKKGSHPGAPDDIGAGDPTQASPKANGYSTASPAQGSPVRAVGTDASVGTDQEYWPPPPPVVVNGDAPQTASEGVGTDQPPSPTTSTASASSTSSSKWQCVKCGENMSGGDVAVFAERAGVDKCWHPGCFRCTTCNELLVDLIYFFKGDNIYCGRHYADTLKPRCAACDELIFALSYTQAEDRNWHVNHFCCFECDTPLGGQQYVAKDSHPYCMECHSKKFAKVCTSCGMKIGAGVPRLSHNKHHWHADDDCFRCSNCKITLVGKSFLPKEGYIFCSTKCKKQLLR
ncbi:testin-like isoform X3 [Lytechinus variegatus]|uniref:testin-like isoform X3 n=1 Tax=Lytechinus variegatus TaxID=7654 RepID=UPI001BB13F20|nr:testin-like isoform X3 [Lytechinus variegatus]